MMSNAAFRAASASVILIASGLSTASFFADERPFLSFVWLLCTFMWGVNTFTGIKNLFNGHDR